MLRAFITGVTGFAGSHLAEHLLSAGDTVLGCSQRGGWPPSMPRLLANEVAVLNWDLALQIAPAAKQQLIRFAPDVVYHLAAISVPADCGQSQPTPRAVAANVGGTKAVIELCCGLPSQPKLIFVSSSYVYAPVSLDSPSVDEAAPLGPRGGYGKTKLAAERCVEQAGQQHLVSTVIVRAFQHTGPRQSPRMILPDWARQLVAPGQDPVRVICLDAYLDLTDVRDIVRAYRALAVDGRSGSVYNVGSGVCQRSGAIMEIAQQCAGRRRRVTELEPGRRQHPIADITRLTKATGWKPEIPLETTIIDTLKYWRQQGT